MGSKIYKYLTVLLAGLLILAALIVFIQNNKYNNRIDQENQRYKELQKEYDRLKSNIMLLSLEMASSEAIMQENEKKLKIALDERDKYLKKLHEKDEIINNLVAINHVSPDSADRFYTNTVIPSLRARFGSYIQD